MLVVDARIMESRYSPLSLVPMTRVHFEHVGSPRFARGNMKDIYICRSNCFDVRS